MTGAELVDHLAELRQAAQDGARGVNVSAADREDAAAEALALAWQHRARLDTGRVCGWVATVAYHAALAAARRPRTVELDMARDRTRGPSTAELAELREQLHLAELAPRHARSVLAAGMGFSRADQARMFGESLRTVDRQLVRGRRTLAGARA